jgi:hypothetical protein
MNCATPSYGGIFRLSIGGKKGGGGLALNNFSILGGSCSLLSRGLVAFGGNCCCCCGCIGKGCGAIPIPPMNMDGFKGGAVRYGCGTCCC